MKFDMPTCASTLCKKDVARFEKLITKKYKKFIWLYNIIKSDRHLISDLNYHDDSDDNILIIDIAYASDVDTDSVSASIEALLEENSKVLDFLYEVSLSNQNITIEIRKEE